MLEFLGLICFAGIMAYPFVAFCVAKVASDLWDFVQDAFPYVLCFLFFAMSIILVLIGIKNIRKDGKKAKRKAVFSFIASALLFIFLPHEYSLTYLRDSAKPCVCGLFINNTSENESIECIKVKYTDDGKWYKVYPGPLTGYTPPMHTLKFNMSLLLNGNLFLSDTPAGKHAKSSPNKNGGAALCKDRAYGDSEFKFEKFSLMIITSDIDTQKEKKATFNKVYFEKKYILRYGADKLNFTYDGDSITMNVNSKKSPGQYLFETTSSDNLFSDGTELKQSYQANYKAEIWRFWRMKGIRLLRTSIRCGGISIF